MPKRHWKNKPKAKLTRYRSICRNDPNGKYQPFSVMKILYHEQTNIRIENISTQFAPKNICKKFSHLGPINMRHRVIIHNDPFDPYNTKSIFHPIDYKKCACDFDNQSFTVCWLFILTSLLRYRGIFKIDPNKKYRQFLILVILYH